MFYVNLATRHKKVNSPDVEYADCGASGYAGAELVTYVNRHPHMT